MLDLKTLVAEARRLFEPFPRPARQQRLMLVALNLLLVTLGFVLYWDRDFWFHDASEGEALSQPGAVEPSGLAPSGDLANRQSAFPDHKKSHTSKPQMSRPAAAATRSGRSSDPSSNPTADSTAPITATATRTVLPPLEVEVVAGNVPNSVPAASNSVNVDLKAGTPPQTPADLRSNNARSDDLRSGDPASATTDTAASTTTRAAERVEMPPDPPSVVSRTVQPNYPLLARQMKVQGSVVLQALISRDGQIQSLRVVSGPPILAQAAQEAVHQWHFKPHYEGAQAVETQARITVNFTISTN